METWGVLVWNMARAWSRGPASDTWAHLWKLMTDHSVQVALLTEADVFSLRAANDAAARDGKPAPAVFSDVGTIGRDSWDKDGVRTPYNRKRWSAAVVSPLGPELLGEDDVRATAPSRKNIDVPFTNSRPGTWVAATTEVGAERVTGISLYGLIEELTDASMHRSLSEISPIFSDPVYNELVLLGGDFNVGTGLAEPPARERSRIVLERIRAYGMIDCLAMWRKDERLPPLTGCRCVDEPCLHTLTRLVPNKEGEHLAWQERISPQVDYLFASKALAGRLHGVVDISPDDWERYSDHSPIIVKFRAAGS